MKIETDLKYIAKIAKQKDDENWEFRSFLKAHDMDDAELDAIVRRLNEQITAQIDCTECGNCCKQSRPTLDTDDVTRFAIGLEMSVEEFQAKHLRPDEDEAGNYEFTGLPCQFLAHNLCTNYEYRPESCMSFPHLHKDGFRRRLFGMMLNYEICPIIFNVYEQLKIQLWKD